MANNESEKIIAEQKAEIERLTKENDKLVSSVACERVTNRQLKEMLDNFHDCDKLLRKENAELQKQVDELTAKREVGREKLKNEIATKIFMGCSYSVIACGKMTIERAKLEAEQYIEFAWDMVQQAVKDTVTKYHNEIRKRAHYSWLSDFHEFMQVLAEIEKNEFGVEVE